MAHVHQATKFHNYFTVILLVIVDHTNAYAINFHEPCHYLDSINITDGIFNNIDGSITFEGINYPISLYAPFDYELVDGSFRKTTTTHFRGCTCKLKPCVRMCCPRGQFLYKSHCYANDTFFDVPVPVSNDGKNFVKEEIFNVFNYVIGKPCHGITAMEPEEYPDTDSWVLFRNGSVLKGVGVATLLSKNNYCLNPTPYNHSIELMTCFEPSKDSSWLPIGMFTSVPFLVVTILVYTILPELRNVHGKSLVCYLLGLIVGYTTLGWIKLNGSFVITSILCRTLGYVVYFAFISAFFWLNAISFELWWNFRHFVSFANRGRRSGGKRFLFYSMYAWGSAIFMVGLCYLVDNTSEIPSDFKPGIGAETCFFKKSRLPEFLYLYLPIILIMTCNSTFFVLTALKIYKVQIEMSRISAQEDSRRHQKKLAKEKAKFGLFFRLFVVMGVTWTMEAVSWIISPNAWYFDVTDLTNAIQGVLIFLLFVMKPKIKSLIINRWNIWRGKKLGGSQGTSSKSGSTPARDAARNTIKNKLTEVELITSKSG